MEKNTVKKLSHSIFILAFLSALLTILQVSTIFTWLTIGVAIIYLFGGWYLFKGYYPEGNPILLFIMGYLYGGILLGLVLASNQWPLWKEMLGVSFFWWVAIVTIILIVKIRNKTKGLNQFYIEAIILLILMVLVIVMQKG